MKTLFVRLAGTLTALAAMSQSLQAHAVSTDLGDFYGGLLHPLTSPEHLLPLTALGLFAGQQSPRAGRRGLALLLFGLAMGLALSRLDSTWTLPTRLNEVSILLFGALVATAWRQPGIVGWLALAAGLTHGYANGAALTEGMAGGLFMSGVITAGLLLFSIVAGTAVPLTSERSRIALRVVGSWIAATGIMLLALRL